MAIIAVSHGNDTNGYKEFAYVYDDTPLILVCSNKIIKDDIKISFPEIETYEGTLKE